MIFPLRSVRPIGAAMLSCIAALIAPHTTPAAAPQAAAPSPQVVSRPHATTSAQTTTAKQTGAAVPATIGDVRITHRDVDAMRALLQPPPPRDAAERLAVDAARAFFDIHGWLAGSSAKGRLLAWRAWLSALDDDTSETAMPQRAREQLALVGKRNGKRPAFLTHAERRLARIKPTIACATLVSIPTVSPQPAESTAPSAESTISTSQDVAQPLETLLQGQALDFPNATALIETLDQAGIEARLADLSGLPLAALERPLAEAITTSTPGEIIGPLTTPTAIHWLFHCPPPSPPD